ncbi:hypothetical protein M427DRAFT_362373 [Gonapodya prolifera JEL478]|uniref:C2H2-type domain-containing protein n=1 Tax=Gonapodya prolifera (strain JEL478) TaxID=1344416 RepID=A0A139AB53_GONPJ|nr:hypothetical protein M427DRAFT_362373 [Gonapodya prolifera JEL478]|eukprot:KXS13695.1 hypothetical protein M427DRAFT_362373 [Gonapodya prolifera JEL478]
MFNPVTSRPPSVRMVKTITCPRCGKNFTRKDVMKRHTTRKTCRPPLNVVADTNVEVRGEAEPLPAEVLDPPSFSSNVTTPPRTPAPPRAGIDGSALPHIEEPSFHGFAPGSRPPYALLPVPFFRPHHTSPPMFLEPSVSPSPPPCAGFNPF